jgi:hypothetical protein
MSDGQICILSLIVVFVFQNMMDPTAKVREYNTIYYRCLIFLPALRYTFNDLHNEREILQSCIDGND